MKHVNYVSLDEAAGNFGFSGDMAIWFFQTANLAPNFPRFWEDGETKADVDMAADYLIDNGSEHFFLRPRDFLKKNPRQMMMAMRIRINQPMTTTTMICCSGE